MAYDVLQQFIHSVTRYLLRAAIVRSLLGINFEPPSVYGSRLFASIFLLGKHITGFIILIGLSITSSIAIITLSLVTSSLSLSRFSLSTLFVYNIPYRRARAWPKAIRPSACASKGILHTCMQVVCEFGIKAEQRSR